MSQTALTSETDVNLTDAVRGSSVSGALEWNRGHVEGTEYLTGPLKRTIDIVLSVAFIIALSPLMMIIALLIRVTSRGPILYKQSRHGLNRTSFQVFKFRSMYIDAGQQNGFTQAVRNDKRITPVGRFIRRTSIDELPQLFNVLLGDMSLVGPRPHPIALDESFSKHVPNYMDRYDTRPGITGLAQTKGSRGETPTVDHMARRVSLDLYYLRNASLLMDVRILIATVKEVCRSETAF